MRCIHQAAVGIMIAGAASLVGCHGSAWHPNGPRAESNVSMGAVPNATCPMCGGVVEAPAYCEYNGRRLAFCCRDCANRWDAANRPRTAECCPGCCRR